MSQASYEKSTSVAILCKGIINSLLGVLHIIGSYTFEAQAIAGKGSATLERDYLVCFLITGVFILFMGLVDVFCYRGLSVGVPMAWQLSLLCSVFTTLIGMCGVSIYGISPPLVLLLTGLTGLIALTSSRQKQARALSLRH